jgi:cation transport regulator ChaC
VSRVHYFAYGSNLDAVQMRRRCPTARPVGRARLLHHRLDFTHLSTRWRGGAADVVPHSGESVWGVLYELAARELPVLDRYEAGYERVLLQVEDESGTARSVISYTVRRKGSFRPTRTYLDKILAWGARFELPDDYLDRLRAVRGGGPARRCSS